MFAYCNSNPVNYQDDIGTRMEYASFDCGAPVAFPSASTLSRTTPQTTDTKENVCKNLIEQAKDSWDYGVEVYNSPLVQRPMGTYSYLDGITSITVGVELILTPYPTLADEILGIVKIFTGFYDVVTGLKARHPSV